VLAQRSSMPMAQSEAAAWYSASLVELCDRNNVQDVGEVHVGAGEMWVPQFGDWLYGRAKG
jgi:hypothetical protein